jgi:hypothetical protein
MGGIIAKVPRKRKFSRNFNPVTMADYKSWDSSFDTLGYGVREEWRAKFKKF